MRRGALAVSTAVALAGCGGSGGEPPTGQTPGAAVASVVIVAPTTSVTVGESLQLAATLRDQSGNALSGRPVAWSTSDGAVLSVATTGRVTGLAPGSATITATSEGKSGTVVITAVPAAAPDFAVVGAQFTQGVQDAAGSIPMVLSGDAAAVNVLIRSTPQTATPMQVVLRLFNAAGALLRSDTAVTSGTLGPSPDYAQPSVQFLVPAAALQAGLRWQVARDPRGLVPDQSAMDDVYPPSGPEPLATLEVPALTIRFVPIVLASHNNATGLVTDALIPEYLRTLRSIHPVGRVDAHVGASLTTTASFGTPPSGGDATFWTQLVSELDLARVLDPDEPTANWYGVVVPPAGFTFTAYGGFSYIPASGADAGPHTRTSTGVQLNWFTRPTQARDLVAHELGHTFGRLHAPCGAAGAPLDPAFPTPGGTLDVPGHDVFSWATGRTSSAVTVATSVGDVMGYCFPVWENTYTYRAILNFRQAQSAVGPARAADPATRVLVVRGSIEVGRRLMLEPVFAVEAHAALPARPGPYRVTGRAGDGRVLFSYAFEPAVLDHAPAIRHFTLAIPIASEAEEALDEVRLAGPQGETRVTGAVPSPGGVPRLRAGASAARAADGALSVSCGDPVARGILLLDGRTGRVLGSAPAGSIRVAVGAARPLTVLCSDGVRTSRSGVTAPN